MRLWWWISKSQFGAGGVVFLFDEPVGAGEKGPLLGVKPRGGNKRAE